MGLLSEEGDAYTVYITTGQKRHIFTSHKSERMSVRTLEERRTRSLLARDAVLLNIPCN